MTDIWFGFNLQNSEILWLMPLPLLVRWLLPRAYQKQNAALFVPFFKSLKSGVNPELVSTRWRFYLALLIWACLLAAASRPQWTSDPIERPKSGRDIILAVDLSASMETEDFVINERNVNRLDAAKFVLSEFIQRRKGDRVGLIFFASKAYVASPLSYDLETIVRLLNEAQIRMIGKMTAIGDALGLAAKRLHQNPDNHRVVVLLSDGNNTSGVLSAERAAHYVALEKLKIYTIGMGDKSYGSFGASSYEHSASLNENTLREVAGLTGGRYFHAGDFEKLQQIYAQIDQLEPRISGANYYRQVEELFYWPLAGALILSFCLAAWFLIYSLLQRIGSVGEVKP